MELTVEKRQAWGQIRYYPCCKVSQVLCDLMNKQTLCRTDIEALKKAGFTFKQKVEEI